MFRLLKIVFVVLLRFGESLPTKCVPLDNEISMGRPTLMDLNLFELNYYSS